MQRVVVSGGGSGIGLAIAESFAADGHEVVILGRRGQVLDRAAAGSDRIRWHAVDLSVPEEVEACAAAIVQDGPVDVVVNSAGANCGAHHADVKSVSDAWDRNLKANLMTAVLLTSALVPHLRRPGGRIITIGSIAASRGGPPVAGGDSYAAAKAALHAWTFGLAKRLGPDEITVNVVAPGYVAGTEITDNEAERWRGQVWVAQALIPRVGLPADVAAAVRYLAAPAAAYVTGQILQVNGGARVGGS